MAAISDFYLTLVDGGLEFSTTDTTFHGGGEVYIWLQSVPLTTSRGIYTTFSSGGNGTWQFEDYWNWNHFPTNVKVVINDDEEK